MNLRAIGCNVSSAAVGLRERLAFDETKTGRALAELNARFAAEAVILGTCNRVEIYLSRTETVAPLHIPLMAEFLSEVHGVPATDIVPHLYEHADAGAAKHLFRVAAGLDSVVVGEGQIAGQVKEAYEAAQKLASTGPLLNALFPAALRVSKRVRSETGIAQGHVSVSSAAVDFVRQVFDTFTDKTVLVIGAGKMGRLTLNHLAELNPAAVLVTNRNPERAAASAAECGGHVVPWDQLDDALVRADIVLSTTGARDFIVHRRRFDEKVRPRRAGRVLVVFDMAVPRDFDPRIHDGDTVSVFNVDDLARVADQRMAERRRYLPAAEAIVEAEVAKFVSEWNKRANGPVIGQLTAEVDKLRDGITGPLLAKMNGKLTDAEKAYIEQAFRLFQNKLLHGPIAALHEASREGHSGGLREALMKLFGLKG
ncbi:glutamyl-tRNA reductase [Frigoriglobus tundricola]|uniref:Glutamyl-tRNA reductase n=1 Tax=Frigoriglobus tundricola TaxID=2774151 RepID=A0A6M5YWH0_9BACT|nr:glutamyl-tRNA reductase [Frigoriglobus tundricola]QJW97553.1 Glutamyl-tRNA reductase [Frigoriglobus tundricola]